MDRDLTIQSIFETADDSLHGIIGYHLYINAMQKTVNREEIKKHLPEKSFQTTFSWVRFYNKDQLILTFEPPILELYQCKILLVAVTGVFEALLGDFIKHLQKKGLIKSSIKENYKAYIYWAYEQTLKSEIGEKVALERLPQTFGIIDNTRRLRNLFTHNSGIFTKQYKSDAIKKRSIVVDFHPLYNEFEKNSKQTIPLIVDWNYLHRLILAHIEVLHILHNQIQNEFFGIKEGYSYAKEGKPIIYEKALWGNANVKLNR